MAYREHDCVRPIKSVSSFFGFSSFCGCLLVVLFLVNVFLVVVFLVVVFLVVVFLVVVFLVVVFLVAVFFVVFLVVVFFFLSALLFLGAAGDFFKVSFCSAGTT